MLTVGKDSVTTEKGWNWIAIEISKRRERSNRAIDYEMNRIKLTEGTEIRFAGVIVEFGDRRPIFKWVIHKCLYGNVGLRGNINLNLF